MIKLTRLSGREFYLNPHQIETIEQTPDTVITVVSGQKYVVREDTQTLIEEIIEYRRKINTPIEYRLGR